MVRNFERNQPVMLDSAHPGAEEPALRPDNRPTLKRPGHGRYGMVAFFFVSMASAFWVGIWGAYLWGYFGEKGLLALPLQQMALFAAAILLPPLLFIAVGSAMTFAHRMGRTAEALQGSAEQLFTVDERASSTAARLGRVGAPRDRCPQCRSRRRVRTPQGAGDGAGKSDRSAGRSGRPRRSAGRSDRRAPDPGRPALEIGFAIIFTSRRRAATEMVAGRAAQLKSAIETAEGSLKMAAQSLDVQAAGFRAAAHAAAEAPHAAAVELDSHAKKIESVSDAALARAEFVLARQEKHRTAMTEMLAKLKEDSALFETSLSQQRAGME